MSFLKVSVVYNTGQMNTFWFTCMSFTDKNDQSFIYSSVKRLRMYLYRKSFFSPIFRLFRFLQRCRKEWCKELFLTSSSDLFPGGVVVPYHWVWYINHLCLAPRRRLHFVYPLVAFSSAWYLPGKEQIEIQVHVQIMIIYLTMGPWHVTSMWPGEGARRELDWVMRLVTIPWSMPNYR